MSDEYRHTDIDTMLSIAEKYYKAYQITYASLAITSAIAWVVLGIVFIFELYHVASLIFVIPALVSLGTSARDWWNNLRIFQATKAPLFRAFAGLKEAEMYSEAQIEMWEVTLMSLYREDLQTVRRLTSHTEES